MRNEQNVGWMGDGLDTPWTVMTTRAPTVLIISLTQNSDYIEYHTGFVKLRL